MIDIDSIPLGEVRPRCPIDGAQCSYAKTLDCEHILYDLGMPCLIIGDNFLIEELSKLDDRTKTMLNEMRWQW